MEPFHQIFPDAPDPVQTLTLPKKTGTIPKGTYGFIECYCTDPGCDCRRVLVLVLDLKMKQKAAISFGFDQTGPMDGPYLEHMRPQPGYAPELLDLFVEALNDGPQWPERIYRQYRAVREMADGKAYRGKAFPKPGKLVYRASPAPELDALLAESLAGLIASGRRESAPAPRKRGASGRPAAAKGRAQGESAGDAAQGMALLLKRYLKLGNSLSGGEHAALQDDLRQCLQGNELAGEELAALLPALCQQSPEDDERIDAALRLLFDTLDTLRLDLERRRPAAQRQMERLQGALARHVFLENEDLDLCAAVSHILLQSRVEILPVLREANSRMMRAGAARADLQDEPGEEMMAGIARSLESMGLDSPFEGVEALLQLFALNEPEVQTALIAEMLGAENPLLREISALMLFHPDAEVRLGVSRLLPGLEGSSIAPATLRRLIVSRNWFPEEIRKNVDQAITAARKARVECAPLVKAAAVTVHGSGIDGTGAQSFQVIVPDGKGFLSCSILLKQGVGVTDAFVVPLANKRELNGFLAMLKEEAAFLESTPEHLDLRVCQALADGVRQGRAPSYWLVRIAELLGCDRWQAAGFDPSRELEQLRAQIASLFPKLLDERERLSALEDSADWQVCEPMFSSWFEDDDLLDREIKASLGKRKTLDQGAAVERIRSVVLEGRRAVWLERLVLTTLLLKSSRKAPVPWYRLFHVAQAVADAGTHLKEIPLMLGIAELSFVAYLERARSDGSAQRAAS